jgi:hypothetical protein
MQVTATRAPNTERNRLGRCLRRAERRLRWPTDPAAWPDTPTTGHLRHAKQGPEREMLDRTASTGELSVMSQATWGMSGAKV